MQIAEWDVGQLQEALAWLRDMNRTPVMRNSSTQTIQEETGMPPAPLTAPPTPSSPPAPLSGPGNANHLENFTIHNSVGVSLGMGESMEESMEIGAGEEQEK